MKKKNRILILGIISIIVLISVQFMILEYIWAEKDVMFDIKYKSLSQEAMEQLSRLKKTDGFDNALNFLNTYSEEVMTKEIKSGMTESDLKALRKRYLKV